jgi:outer membrane protein insertion porin family
MGSMTGAQGCGRRSIGKVRFPVRRVAAALFLGLATPCLPVATAAHAQAFTFSNVVIEGNERVEAATVLSFAGIARGASVSAGQLNDATQRLVDSGLFESAELIPQGSTLLIRVREFPTINVINFEGNRRLDDERLQGLISSQSRRVYSPAQAEADAAAITSAYEAAGRYAARVEPRIIRRDGNRVDLVFEVREGGVVEIERIGFVGNRDYSDRRLRQVLGTKQAGLLRTFIGSDTFVADRLELDKQMLRDFYLSRGYVDFQVIDASAEVTRERDAFFLTFSIREGRSFRVGAVDTVSDIPEIDPAEFAREVRLRPGVTYSPTVIDNNIARLENLALQKGLNFVRVEPRLTRNDRTQTLDVTFAIVRGERLFVERIDIEGNTTTRDDVVRRQFRTVEGDPFNPREIRQAAERIRALGFFSNAAVEAESGSAADRVVVNVDVEEQATGSLGLGLTYGTEDGLGATISFAEQNFLGRGQSIAVDISTSADTSRNSLSFTEPAFLGRDLRFSLDVYYNQTNQSNSDYDTRNIGVRSSIGFPLGPNGRVDLRFRVSQDEIRDVDPDSSDILKREADRGALLTTALGYGYSFDTRRNGLSPNSSFVLRFNQDFAGLGGDVTSVSTSVFAVAERRVLNEDVTLRAVFEGGAVAATGGDGTRVTDRFFGNGKIRGFEPNGIGPRDLSAANEDALGGNFFAVARFEAEFPLGLPEEYGIRGGLFLDVGSVWGLDDRAGTAAQPNGDALVDDSAHLRSAVGVSLFWDTPIGPLRFNLSKVLEKEDYDKEQSFDLTISTRF